MTEQTATFEAGQTVQLQDGRKAVVRFVGGTSFAPGDWVGIELPSPTGKNDGSVQGTRYFSCKPVHGMFVRPAAVAFVRPERSDTGSKLNGSSPTKPTRPRVSVSAPKRQSVASMSVKRQSTSTQGSASGSGRSQSPPKSPTKGMGFATASAPTASRLGALSQGARARPSIGQGHTGRPSAIHPKLARPSRPSITSPSRPARANGMTNIFTGSQDRVPFRPRTESNLRPSNPAKVGRQDTGTTAADSKTSDDMAPARSPPSSMPSDTASQGVLSPLLSPRSAASGTLYSGGAPPGQESTSPLPSHRTTVSGIAASKEVEELKMKLRLMEKKRMDDRDRLKSLDRIQSERDRFENIIQKLQAKYQPQQKEISELRKQLKAAEMKMDETMVGQAENDVAIEMATLDREMAEETAEALKAELEALKSKTQELELEVEVLREENQALGEEISPEEKASQGWLQMEKSNDRLREALIRLRDMTEEQEAELKLQVQGLEADVQEMAAMKVQLDETKGKLHVSEERVDDLKQQLEVALGAEEMIEELTEKNINMSEQISELKATVEDLESLKELSDELELNHTETEKQMQEEVDYKDSLLAEQARRAARQGETIEQHEYTLSRFRELVRTLQGDVEDLRASKQITETEAAELTSHSRTMMDLNMKLQTAAARTQMKTIDMELQRLEAQEASERLSVVQLFLPEAFQAERNSILTLLRFKRLAFKARLLHEGVKEHLADRGTTDQKSNVFVVLDALDKLLWIAVMCDRFVNCMSSCSTTEFVAFETALDELEPVERTLDGWTGTLRRDELDHRQCAAQLQRLIAVMGHLAEVHLPESLNNYATDVYMRALLVQSYLDNCSSAISFVRDTLQAKLPPAEEEEEIAQGLGKKMDDTIMHSRSLKVVIAKAARSIDELKARCLSVDPASLALFERCVTSAEKLKTYSAILGNSIVDLVSSEDHAVVKDYAAILERVEQAAFTCFGVKESQPLKTVGDRLRSLAVALGDLSNLGTDLSRTVEFERPPAPWIVRARNLRAAERVPQDVEEKMQTLKETIQATSTQLKLRDQALEESNVKIELLEARTTDAARKAEKIVELERAVAEGHRKETSFDEALAASNRELQQVRFELDRSRETLKSEGGSGALAKSHANNGGIDLSATAERVIQDLEKEIAFLQGAVRYLEDDNERLRTLELKQPTISAEARAPRRATPAQSVAQGVRSEGKDSVGEMLRAFTRTPMLDLQQTPSKPTKWRPTHTTPRWRITKQQEEWEQWRDWTDEVAAKSRRLTFGVLAAEAPRAQTQSARKAKKTRPRWEGTTAVDWVMDQANKLRKYEPLPSDLASVDGPVVVDDDALPPGRAVELEGDGHLNDMPMPLRPLKSLLDTV